MWFREFWWLWVIVLGILMLSPVTRELAIGILLIAGTAGAFRVGWNQLVLPLHRQHQLGQAEKLRLQDNMMRVSVLLKRITLLQGLAFEWVKGDTPEQSLLYRLVPGIHVKEVLAFRDVLFHIETTLESLGNQRPLIKLESIEAAYTALVGYPLPHISWMALVNQLEILSLEMQDMDPRAYRQSILNFRLQGDWMLDDVHIITMEARKNSVGILHYIFRPWANLLTD